jgi:hypothetical protein
MLNIPCKKITSTAKLVKEAEPIFFTDVTEHQFSLFNIVLKTIGDNALFFLLVWTMEKKLPRTNFSNKLSPFFAQM